MRQLHPDKLPLTLYHIGHCVLTVGTDAKTILKIEGVKLLPSHAYAVVGGLSKVISVWLSYAHRRSNLDVRETKNERFLTLIDSRVPATNPPVHAKRKNRPSSSDPRECGDGSP